MTYRKRIVARPSPEQWQDDELLTLSEAAVLFWPNGPVSAFSLATAARAGSLFASRVGKKYFTTPEAVRRMIASQAPTSRARVSDSDQFDLTLQLLHRIRSYKSRRKSPCIKPPHARRGATPVGSGR